MSLKFINLQPGLQFCIQISQKKYSTSFLGAVNTNPKISASSPFNRECEDHRIFRIISLNRSLEEIKIQRLLDTSRGKRHQISLFFGHQAATSIETKFSTETYKKREARRILQGIMRETNHKPIKDLTKVNYFGFIILSLLLLFNEILTRINSYIL